MLDSLRILYPSEYPFDHRDFMSSGGKIIVVMAGGGAGIAGATDGERVVVRGRGLPLVNMNYPYQPFENKNMLRHSRMDGIAVSCHEIGHAVFGWYHTGACTYDIMAGTVDVNCPPHPNPVNKMKQGWLEPIAIESSQQLQNLSAIETHYTCGVITIYGKPPVAPDWSTGESLVVENRRRLKFDRKLIDSSFFRINPQWSEFTGGLLVWHYCPYYTINFGSNIGYNIRLKTPRPEDSVFVPDLLGDARHFFAFLPGEESFYYQFLSNRTKSGAGLSTGIEFTNISQNNDKINSNINYSISPPRQYSDVIYLRALNRHVVNYSDTVFFHQNDTDGFFRFSAGTVIENPGGIYTGMNFKGIESEGTLNFPIKFTGVGYDQTKTTYISISIQNHSSYSYIDSLILKNFKFYNYLSPSLSIAQQFFSTSSPPLIFENIEFVNTKPYFTLTNIVISKINQSNAYLGFTNKAKFNGIVDLEDVTLSFNGSKFTFENSNSFLSIKSNDYDTVLVKDSLQFKNGSKLIANGVSFVSISPLTSLWNGIQFENLCTDTTMNCKFYSAKTALSIINTNAVSKYTNRIIKENVFTVPTGGNYKAIYGENNYSMLVQNNRFNLPQSSSGTPFYVGLFLKNTGSSEPPEVAGEEGENETPTYYNLNIINNTFRNGSASMVLANYNSNFLPYYIKGNKFDSLNTNAATLNILGMNITGTIKDNILTSMQTPMGVHLINSNPDFYNNFIGAKKVSLHLVGHSYPNLAPYISGDEMIWTGGKNRLSTDSMDNIQLAVQGNVFTDYGRNRFTILDNAYHIYGWIDSNITTYYSRNNCWYAGDAAKIYLRLNAATPPIPTVTYNYGLDCNSEPGPIGSDVDYMGNGIWDSTFKTEDESQSIPSTEEMLAAQCEHYMNELQMYQEAITSLKSYIDDYPTGNYVKDAMNNLYSCYLYLDTSTSQSYRNTLFGNLINYAEEKVASNNYGEDFELVAGDVIAMCEANVLNYSNAMNWYEFIALYYPDPDIRLAASWNYAEIDALLNFGNGGGEKDLGLGISDLGFNEQMQVKEMVRMNKVIGDNPLMRKMKKSFDKLSKNRKEKIDYDLKTILKDKRNLDRMIKKSDELDKLKEDKASRNIFESGMYSKEQSDDNRMLDLILTTREIRSEIEADNSSIIPLEYKLSQNYPNPFNPTTTISYEIPKDGFVKIKVYDITGKELLTLVNELKQAGTYETTFDGINFASGVYFYKIEVGNFVHTKRMALIK